MTELELKSLEWETDFIAPPPLVSVLAGFTGVIYPPEGSTIASIVALAERDRLERNLEVLRWSR